MLLTKRVLPLSIIRINILRFRIELPNEIWRIILRLTELKCNVSQELDGDVVLFEAAIRHSYRVRFELMAADEDAASHIWAATRIRDYPIKRCRTDHLMTLCFDGAGMLQWECSQCGSTIPMSDRCTDIYDELISDDGHMDRFPALITSKAMIELAIKPALPPLPTGLLRNYASSEYDRCSAIVYSDGICEAAIPKRPITKAEFEDLFGGLESVDDVRAHIATRATIEELNQ